MSMPVTAHKGHADGSHRAREGMPVTATGRALSAGVPGMAMCARASSSASIATLWAARRTASPRPKRSSARPTRASRTAAASDAASGVAAAAPPGRAQGSATRNAARIAIPPPRGVGRWWEERALGRSCSPRRAPWRASRLVAKSDTRAAAVQAANWLIIWLVADRSVVDRMAGKGAVGSWEPRRPGKSASPSPQVRSETIRTESAQDPNLYFSDYAPGVPASVARGRL